MNDRSERRAEYGRRLVALHDRLGLSERRAAELMGMSPETYRGHLRGTSAPRTRAAVRKQDEVLGGGGTLEDALFGPASQLDETPELTPELVDSLASTVAALAARIDQLERGLAAVQPAPPRPRKAGRSAAQSR